MIFNATRHFAHVGGKRLTYTEVPKDILRKMDSWDQAGISFFSRQNRDTIFLDAEDEESVKNNLLKIGIELQVTDKEQPLFFLQSVFRMKPVNV